MKLETGNRILATGSYRDQIYLGTVLLERNRWAKGERVPTLAVSDWIDRIAGAGFDGIELWQNHALLAPDDEREKLRRSAVPVKLFNSYARCDADASDERKRAVEAARFFGAAGMKFNFGRDPEKHTEYVQSVMAWRAQLPGDFRFLCECHGGTTMEDVRRAADTFEAMGRDGYEVIIHAFGEGDADWRWRFACHGSRITHVHVSMPPPDRLPEKEMRGQVDRLRAEGFRGSFTIEFTEGVGDAGECVETLFRHAKRDLERLRKCLA